MLEARGEEVRHREEAPDARRRPPVVPGVSQGGEASPGGPLLDGKVGRNRLFVNCCCELVI